MYNKSIAGDLIIRYSIFCNPALINFTGGILLEEKETITITIRNINADDWNKLSDAIGGVTRSQFIRDAIKNQLDNLNSVDELKKEIRELEDKIKYMQDELTEKKQKLGAILQSQSENADNELMIETILSAIKRFNDDKGGISKGKIKGILREDYNDCISFNTILKRAKTDLDLTWVDNVQELHSKSSNPVEEKEKEKTKEDYIKKVKEKMTKYIKMDRKGLSKRKVRVILSDENNKEVIQKRIELYKLTDDEVEKIICELENEFD